MTPADIRSFFIVLLELQGNENKCIITTVGRKIIGTKTKNKAISTFTYCVKLQSMHVFSFRKTKEKQTRKLFTDIIQSHWHLLNSESFRTNLISLPNQKYRWQKVFLCFLTVVTISIAIKVKKFCQSNDNVQVIRRSHWRTAKTWNDHTEQHQMRSGSKQGTDKWSSEGGL